MNADTKKHIDSARQVLVGVVPNPASQIDQITNALIYKFMDDMDQAAIKAGGEPSFFVGSLKDYAWTRLMDSKVGNQQRMNLYSEALVKFSEAKQLPELFRGIFKSAYLPYRSPEVLDLFLKEINYFDYSHSEELGNAYEYLLSIMSSQGDAGQFRTPRHIIDFIVEVVNPTKDDKVLDPACGTAGFLISAYKHILSQHDGKNPDGTKNSEKPLTPDQRKTLVNNFEGYDIDPGMVRISQVNMYLHQFKNPKIYQYDSLSSDERWGDKFDVILANPPFMSPQGGIRPHGKFGIRSSRSEVLFVDYIMSHLRPRGRAGIIVPEGIIFKSDSAHKKLRKNLIEDGLYAVVSLPSGVFNPYAGVKTSILLFDNEISKLAEGILFVKIYNDGFDLGAQRRQIDKNDLPESVKILADYRTTVIKGGGSLGDLKSFTKHFDFTASRVSVVSKNIISENGDYNLSGDRYRISDDNCSVEWPMVALEDILEYEQPTNYIVSSVDYSDEYKTPVLTAGKTFILGYTNEKEGIFDKLPVIIFDDFTTATKYVDFSFKVKSSAMKILHVKENVADIKYVFYVMQNIKFSHSEHKRYWISEYSKIKIPFPPIDVQRKIVKEIDSFQSIIDGAKQILFNWNPKIDVSSDWSKFKIRDLCDMGRGRVISRVDMDNNPGEYPVYSSQTKNNGCFGYLDSYDFDGEYVTWTTDGANAGTVFYRNGKFNCTNVCGTLKKKEGASVNMKFLSKVLDDVAWKYVVHVGNPKLMNNVMGDIEIYLPDIKTQDRLIEKSEEELPLIESNKKLIEIYNKKITKVIAKLWEK